MSSPYALRTDVHDGIAVVTFDLPGEPINKINRALKDEFTELFERLERDRNVRAAVLISGKPDTFIAGADIEEFLDIRTATDAERLSLDGQMLLERLEGLRVPVVAAIHGACLGGGLETVLACHYRIATDHPKTVLALPEVKLGLIPGAGGTQRLPRQVGLQNALDMILRGGNVRAAKAKRIGLVEELVHPAILKDIAIRRARDLANGKIKRSRKHGRAPGLRGVVLDSTPPGRILVLRQARQQTLKKTRGHYPALLSALDAVEAGYSEGRESGYREEARLFGEMAVTDVARQLIFLFFATTALKKDPGVSRKAPEPLEVRKLGVLGAGFMGAGIASVAVQEGTVVRLKDTDHARVTKGLAAVREVLKERLVKKQITRTEFDNMMLLTGGTAEYTGFGSVDLVIEAVFEDLKIKHAVLREAEQVIPEHAIYASNTSSIPITSIAEASARSDRVIGMHFFSPVHKMPLLEVVATPATDPEVIVTAVACGKKLGKTVIVVNDGPGFYTTRVLSAYMNEAGKLLDEGAAIEKVDAELVDFGFPVGPITLLDEVGIDVGGKIGQVIGEAFGERLAPSEALRRVVEAGRYGRKAKKGFYRYSDSGKKLGVDESVYDIIAHGRQRMNIPGFEIRERTVLALVNEAARCLEEGILRSARDGDVGAVFGIGFPPFLGGPFRYIDSVGAQEVVNRLSELNDRFAPRFEPAELLVRMARDKERFYPAEGRPV